MEDLLWTLPLVGAVVGWATNWLAVRMLFRPRRPKKFLGMTFVGLIPRRRKELATSVAAAVERELVKPEDISNLLNDPHLLEAAEKEIDARVAEFLDKKFDEIPSIARAVLPADLKDRFRKSIVKHVMAAMPEMSERLAKELGKKLDVKKLVEDRVNDFDMMQLEKIVLELAGRELRQIEVLGGIIGAVVGGAQWAMLHFLSQ